MHDSVFGSMLAGNAENLKLVLLSSPLELRVRRIAFPAELRPGDRVSREI